MDKQQTLSIAKQTLASIKQAIHTCPTLWSSYTRQVEEVMTKLNEIQIYQTANDLEDKLWFSFEILNFAYFEVDTGGIKTIADWSEQAFQQILNLHPNNALAFRGLGQAWLNKAQQYLVSCALSESDSSASMKSSSPDILRTAEPQTTQATAGSSTNTTTSSSSAAVTTGTISTPSSTSAWQGLRDHSLLNEDELADRRRLNSEYVQARTMLLPAVEFFTKAVEIEGSNAGGDLLALQAEAYMSLGNVSFSADAQKYFLEAVKALKRASEIPGYQLPDHLSKYLAEFEYVLKYK